MKNETSDTSADDALKQNYFNWTKWNYSN